MSPGQREKEFCKAASRFFMIVENLDLTDEQVDNHLISRAKRIKCPEKLQIWIDRLENENFHTVTAEVRKIKGVK